MNVNMVSKEAWEDSKACCYGNGMFWELSDTGCWLMKSNYCSVIVIQWHTLVLQDRTEPVALSVKENSSQGVSQDKVSQQNCLFLKLNTMM